jgi:hypothetical protein
MLFKRSNKMATILPLDKKYYGTEVEFTSKTTGEKFIVKVWAVDYNRNPFVSEREIEKGYNPEEDCGPHIEDVQSFEIAKVICEALTKEGY